MIIKAYVYEQASQFGKVYFEGECEALPIKTNNPELQGELVQFIADTKAEVVAQIISKLKARGLTGKLRIAH